jgi:hypothetical protein
MVLDYHHRRYAAQTRYERVLFAWDLMSAIAFKATADYNNRLEYFTWLKLRHFEDEGFATQRSEFIVEFSHRYNEGFQPHTNVNVRNSSNNSTIITSAASTNTSSKTPRHNSSGAIRLNSPHVFGCACSVNQSVTCSVCERKAAEISTFMTEVQKKIGAHQLWSVGADRQEEIRSAIRRTERALIIPLYEL